MADGLRETSKPALRVFLVEDSQRIRERLAEALAAPGQIEVFGYAEDEATAVETLCASPWDAVILDLQLKHGSGFGVLRTLRDKGRPVGAKVIVLTSYAFPLYQEKSAQLGADHFFDKSRDYERVREVLDRMAGER